MNYPEQPTDDTPRKALFDSIGMLPGTVVMFGLGLEATASSASLVGYAAIEVSGVLAAVSGKRWHDFHELRDQQLSEKASSPDSHAH